MILSVAKYKTPAGKKLQDEGVTPGLLVASNTDDGSGDEEGADAPATPVAKPGVSVDEQLSKALDLLKGKAA